MKWTDDTGNCFSLVFEAIYNDIVKRESRNQIMSLVSLFEKTLSFKENKITHIHQAKVNTFVY